MLTIYKFPFQIIDRQKITMPRGAKILCAQLQGGTPCLWAEVDTEQTSSERIIEVHGTGNPMEPVTGADSRTYIGTFQQSPFVWHVYEYEVAGF